MATCTPMVDSNGRGEKTAPHGLKAIGRCDGTACSIHRCSQIVEHKGRYGWLSRWTLKLLRSDFLCDSAWRVDRPIDQRALARAGSARQADDASRARMRKERLEHLRPAGSAVLDGRDGAGQSAGVAGAQTRNLELGILRQRSV